MALRWAPDDSEEVDEEDGGGERSSELSPCVDKITELVASSLVPFDYQQGGELSRQTSIHGQGGSNKRASGICEMLCGDCSKSPLPHRVCLEDEDGEREELEIEYEGLPPRCHTCVCFGHWTDQCPSIKVWKPIVKRVREEGIES